MDFTQKLKAFAARSEAGFERWVPAPTARPHRLHEAMHYSLRAGGKRLRPVMVLAAAELYPLRLDPIPAAVAIECIHTYSLIHDDLPSIDNSDLRRGRPTNHIQFDEATAVLAGDALLTHAFALLGQAYAENPQAGLRMVATLGRASGSEALIGGQMEDILSEGRAITADELDYIQANKTAALLTCALEMGLLCTDAPDEAHDQLRRAGHALGLAFQIVDDILDVTSSDEVMGKSTGNDARSDKGTYVSLHGLEKARADAQRLSDEARNCLRSLDADTTFLEALVDYMAKRDY